MGNLIRMDFYRMRKARSFLICFILELVLALSSAPLEKGMYLLAQMLSTDMQEIFPAEVKLSVILSDPFPALGLMLAMISLCYFFHADVENGYIKNIAGQMPMKGFTILSKFIVAFVHNVIFVAAAIIGKVVGTVFVQRIVVDGDVPDSIRVLVLKLLLIQSICALLLLAAATLRSKSLGMILAVIFGLGLTSLIYMGINQGLKSLFNHAVDITKYMPDSLMDETPLGTMKALAVAAAWGAVFLIPAIRIFDRKDVK